MEGNTPIIHGLPVLITPEEKQDMLKKVYSEVPPSIGILSFHHLVNQKCWGIIRKDCSDFLKHQEYYQKFKPVRRQVVTRPQVPTAPL
eukprot:3200-Eustigmatos_ZCMA.PRE.1